MGGWHRAAGWFLAVALCALHVSCSKKTAPVPSFDDLTLVAKDLAVQHPAFEPLMLAHLNAAMKQWEDAAVFGSPELQRLKRESARAYLHQRLEPLWAVDRRLANIKAMARQFETLDLSRSESPLRLRALKDARESVDEVARDMASPRQVNQDVMEALCRQWWAHLGQTQMELHQAQKAFLSKKKTK